MFSNMWSCFMWLTEGSSPFFPLFVKRSRRGEYVDISLIFPTFVSRRKLGKTASPRICFYNEIGWSNPWILYGLEGIGQVGGVHVFVLSKPIPVCYAKHMGGNEDLLSRPPWFFSNTFSGRIVGPMTGSSVHDLLFSYSVSFPQTPSLKIKTAVKAGTIQPKLLSYCVWYGGATLSIDSIFSAGAGAPCPRDHGRLCLSC